MSEEEQGVRVSTIREVEARLATGRASFEDWIDCLEVCQREERWDLAERCAHEALEAAMQRPLPAVKLAEAAKAVVAGAFPRSTSGPDWLQAGTAGLQQARDLLSARRQAASHRALRQVLDEVLADLDAMLLLLTDDQAASRVKLASLLRDYSRPDLAIKLMDRLVAISRANYFALTVRAGARLDQGDLGGVADAETAHLFGKNYFSLGCLARGLRMAGRLQEALEAALALVDMHETVGSAATLAAAAHAAGDDAALKRAQEILERLEGTPNEQGSDRQVRLLAARQLLRDGQLEEAQVALEALLAERAWPKARDELEKVHRERQLRSPAEPPG
jgi:hypothetical protein